MLLATISTACAVIDRTVQETFGQVKNNVCGLPLAAKSCKTHQRLPPALLK
jgi:hypothetical protein